MPPYRSRSWLLATVLAAVLTVAHASASDVVEVVPVSGRLVMLHFDDGSVSYHGRGQAFTSDTVNVVPLTTAALAAGAFTITSPTHAAFRSGAKPLRTGRKSKGTEYAHNHTNWVDGFGFRPSAPYAALEHWIYLELPAALESGHNYTITWDRALLNTTSDVATLAFDENVTRSEAIHVNTVGYAPGAAQKFGYLYHWAGDLGGIDLAAWSGREFRIVRVADGRVVHTGKVAFRRDAANVETSQAADTPAGNFLGASVWECDFSSLTTPGEYRLAVSGLGCSYDFTIDRDVYREAFHAVMHGLFQNRSGIALAPPHADEPRPAPHNPRPIAEGGTPGFQNRL